MEMNVKEKVLRILRTEYGINSITELESAIKSLGGIDISVFCAKLE